jgi:hypothetical protein
MENGRVLHQVAVANMHKNKNLRGKNIWKK